MGFRSRAIWQARVEIAWLGVGKAKQKPDFTTGAVLINANRSPAMPVFQRESSHAGGVMGVVGFDQDGRRLQYLSVPGALRLVGRFNAHN